MQELELTWRHAISVWWLIVWRGAIGAAVMGGAVGFLVAFLALLAGAPSLYVAYFNMAIGALIGVFWMIVVVRMALRKNYRGFHLALVANTP
jgi:hypothetical protein